MRIKYPIGKVMYTIFNNDIQKVVIKTVTYSANGIVYNGYIKEELLFSSYNTAMSNLVKRMKSYIKLVDKTKGI